MPRAGSEGQIHPFAGGRFFRARKANPLNFEFAADQTCKVRSGNKNIPPRAVRLRAGQIQFALQRGENGEIEECDLPLEILAIAEEAIPSNPLPRDTFRRGQSQGWVRASLLITMAVIVMPRRNEDVMDLH